jgi:hypothetical protein
LIITRWGGHKPTLPISDPRPLGSLHYLGTKSGRYGKI